MSDDMPVGKIEFGPLSPNAVRTEYDRLKVQYDAMKQAAADKITKPLHVEIDRLTAELADVRAALLVVLDQVDYTANACGVTEMVGAVLPLEVIRQARAALKSKGQ